MGRPASMNAASMPGRTLSTRPSTCCRQRAARGARCRSRPSPPSSTATRSSERSARSGSSWLCLRLRSRGYSYRCLAQHDLRAHDPGDCWGRADGGGDRGCDFFRAGGSASVSSMSTASPAGTRSIYEQNDRTSTRLAALLGALRVTTACFGGRVAIEGVVPVDVPGRVDQVLDRADTRCGLLALRPARPRSARGPRAAGRRASRRSRHIGGGDQLDVGQLGLLSTPTARGSASAITGLGFMPWDRAIP